MVKRVYKARWYVPSFGEYTSASEKATTYAEAVAKLNAQWDAGIELGERIKGRPGRVIWSGGRRGEITVIRA